MKPRVNELIAVTVTHPGSGDRDGMLVDVQTACAALKFDDPAAEATSQVIIYNNTFEAVDYHIEMFSPGLEKCP